MEYLTDTEKEILDGLTHLDREAEKPGVLPEKRAQYIELFYKLAKAEYRDLFSELSAWRKKEDFRKDQSDLRQALYETRRLKAEKERDELLVQVTKEPYGNKGARVTMHLSLPGRFLVLVPNANNIGVSRKIKSFKEKKRLKNIAREIKPEGCGLIIRTMLAIQ